MFTMLHPHIVRSYKIIRKWFIIIFNEQKSFINEKCK